MAAMAAHHNNDCGCGNSGNSQGCGCGNNRPCPPRSCPPRPSCEDHCRDQYRRCMRNC
ncbi:hypothetical protein MKC55_17330 [[Clostridium] innocuum]|uniref:Uncharacterized protein n=2 Tax=Clostridium innocuum TaxID=1522 RepID=A0AAP9MFS3_CLOIN|nr:hypothetical protein [[Clostridium] innocuum]MBS9794792.1 hypothetical protein [[Clostridium] innocuum]MBU9114875.1 hypothetical protein [[Clostridium] innocuum]MCH1945240.1 hypothetical protein [[Clostridium] innocuum]MCH1956123.1 hypothetical protein [[Clostridium] innocuum]MCR0196728.1 hypothetical protein [[Clostridium] innocuum]